MRRFGWRRSRRIPGPTYTSRRLVKILLEAGIELPVLAVKEDRIIIERTRAGHWQRAQGAWSWCLSSTSEDTSERAELGQIGSCYPVHQIIKMGIADTYDSPGGLEIFPNLEKQPEITKP